MSPYYPFATDHDDWSAHMTEDVPFYVELTPRARSFDEFVWIVGKP